jgi:hypothetical protein
MGQASSHKLNRRTSTAYRWRPRLPSCWWRSPHMPLPARQGEARRAFFVLLPVQRSVGAPRKTQCPSRH